MSCLTGCARYESRSRKLDKENLGQCDGLDDNVILQIDEELAHEYSMPDK